MDETELKINYNQKMYLVQKGFFYNPYHQGFQKIAQDENNKRTFSTVFFNEENNNELIFADTIHDLKKTTEYYLYFLFIGKIPKTESSFQSLYKTIFEPNKIADNSMVRYAITYLEKHGYVQEHKLENAYGKNIIEYKFCKRLQNFTLEAYLELPTNKLYFLLNNTETKLQATMLDMYIPRNVPDILNVFNHVTNLFQHQNLQLEI